MKQFQGMNVMNRDEQRGAWRLTPIAAGCAALLLASGLAAAQEAGQGGAAATQGAAPAVQSVVVTGIRRGIEDALQIKRNSESIVEAVSAEDIGKLPDVSIAESIARLPGLTAQRVAGRAQVISIRGLAPDFAGTLINGREIVSTGDNRAAEFDQFPSELINSATVYKTPDAGLIGQGLSGTVDMQTARPLSFKGRQMAVNVRGSYNDLGKLNANTAATGNRVSLSYIDQFADNTVGVALGYAHLDSPSLERHYKSWWWDSQPTSMLGAANAGAIALGGAEVEAISRKQVRDGLMGVLEYKPNKDLHSIVDMYYSRFSQRETMRGLMWSSNQWDGITYTDPKSEVVDGTRILTSGTVNGVKPILRNDYNQREDEVFAFGWNTKLKLDDNWTANAVLGYSKADRAESVLETYAGLATGSKTDSFRFNIPTGTGLPTFTPGLNYADANVVKLTDPGGWGHDGLLNSPKVNDELKSLRLSAKRSLESWFSNIDLGVNFSNREKKRASVENNVMLKNNRAPIGVDASLIDTPTSLSFTGIPGVLAYDALGALSRYYNIMPDENINVWKRDFTITERITTAYAKLGINTDLGPVPVQGNVGVQLVHTEQSSLGLNNNGATSAEVARGASYNNVLPSLNLIFDVARDSYVRFGLARVMARPRIDDLKAGGSAGVDTTRLMWSGEGGNPELRPWLANAIDLSLEKYFGKRSYVALAAFGKDLKSYVYNKQTEFDFTGFPNKTDKIPLSNIGTLNTPVNGQGGMVKGVEFSAGLEGGMLWRPLDGFGLTYSASVTRSSIHPNGPGTSEKLPGLSGTVQNVTLYYEKDGFSSRVSQRYRSAFRGEVTGLFTNRSFSEIASERVVDAQIGYAFETGAYKGWSVLFQVNNLTNEPYRTSNGTLSGGGLAPEQYHTYGRQYLIGVGYKL